MKRILFFALTVASAMVAVSQLKHSYGSSVVSKVGDKEYRSIFHSDLIDGMPPWDTSKQLPLSFAQAERIARAELEKLTEDEGTWEVREFALERVPHTPNWFYRVCLSPPTNSATNNQYYAINILPDGKPCKPTLTSTLR